MVAHRTPLYSTRQVACAESAERNATTASSASLNKIFEGNALTRMSSKLYQGSTPSPVAACLSASWTQRLCPTSDKHLIDASMRSAFVEHVQNRTDAPHSRDGCKAERTTEGASLRKTVCTQRSASKRECEAKRGLATQDLLARLLWATARAMRAS